MKTFQKILLALLIGAKILTAQTDSTLEYFPFHTGDIWQYKTHVFIPYPETSYIVYTTVVVGKDTLMTNGKIYRRMNRFEKMFGDGFYRIDSTTACVYKYEGTTEEILTDSLKATVGDQWSYFRCDSVYRNLIFTVATSVKAYSFSVIPYPVYFHFAKGFGLIRYSMQEENQVYPVADSYETTLIYAKINGQEYGTLVSVKEDEYPLPKNFLLKQNFPNPFNPSTTIRYKLHVKAFITLKIFDLLGREVAMLVNEEQSAGIHSYKLEASNYKLSNGVYFYQLRANNFVETKKLTLIK
jgi:hypothetical protein